MIVLKILAIIGLLLAIPAVYALMLKSLWSCRVHPDTWNEELEDIDDTDSRRRFGVQERLFAAVMRQHIRRERRKGGIDQ